MEEPSTAEAVRAISEAGAIKSDLACYEDWALLVGVLKDPV
jgi:hypothetical protein